jgi:hypothetical protein
MMEKRVTKLILERSSGWEDNIEMDLRKITLDVVK